MKPLRPVYVAGLLALWLSAVACSESHSQENRPQQEGNDVASLAEGKLGQTRNVSVCANLFLTGQFAEEDIEAIKSSGIKRVITLRQDGEIEWDEKTLVEQAGLEFVAVPFRGPETLTDEVFDRVRQLLQDDQTAAMLHCGSANRVGTVWLPYRVLDQGVALDTALEEAKLVGMRNAAYEEKAIDYIKRKSQPDASRSVRPGINSSFLDPKLNIESFVSRFEVESREVYSSRNEVIKACAIKPGSQVADVGAGTGLYTRLFSQSVGEDGWVYAVDIAPRFIEHINSQAQVDRHHNITGVVCQQNSVNLPPNSVDTVFICDTYHHFEYPADTLGSIHRALRPGGQLVVIDFERIEGKTRPWLFDHVRAGKEVFRSEIEGAGFAYVEEAQIPGFEENYFLRFRKQ